MIIEVENTIEEGGWRSSLRLGRVAARAPTLAGKGDIVRESNAVTPRLDSCAFCLTKLRHLSDKQLTPLAHPFPLGQNPILKTH
jgi:hypothetical protein